MSDGLDYDLKRCAKCAAWIPKSATMCAYCNTTAPDAPPERRKGSILSLRHGLSATKILIAANVAYFLFSIYMQYRFTPDGNPAQWAISGTGLREGLYAAGDYRHVEVVRQHQWWRVLGAAFLHVGGIHLAVNMWSLHILGELAERLFGTAKFVAVYVATAICSSLAGSFWFSGVMHLPDSAIHPAAGASGALFGVAGFLVAYLLRAGTDRSRQVAWSIAQSVGLMLVFGYFSSFISQSGHVGGLIPGLAFGFFARADFGGRADPAAARLWSLAASIGTVACVASLLVAAWHAFLYVGGR